LSQRKTSRIPLGANDLTAGVNDTAFPDNRLPTQAKDMTNIRVRQDGAFEKTGGRGLDEKNFGAAGNIINGLAVPPENYYLATLDARNNKLIVKVNVTYYLAEVAVGNYSTYDALALALRNALNTAVVDENWAVAYNSVTSKKFSIKYDGQAFIVLWWGKLPAATTGATDWDTTLDRNLFGFLYSDGAASNTYITSDFEVEALPPTDRIVAAGGKLYNEDKTEITYQDGDSLAINQNEELSGFWHHDIFYFSDNETCFIKRNQWPARLFRNDDLVITDSAWATTAIHHYYSNANNLSPSLDYGLRVSLRKTGVITHIKFLADIYSIVAGARFTIDLYVDMPSIGYHELVHVVTYSDLIEAGCAVTTNGALYTATLSPGVYVDPTSAPAFVAAVLNFDGYSLPSNRPELRGGKRACAISIANPAVVSGAALVEHGFENGDAVVFTSTGTLPSHVVSGTTYYVYSAGANNFQLKNAGGDSINTTGDSAGSGHSVSRPNGYELLSVNGVWSGVGETEVDHDLYIQVVTTNGLESGKAHFWKPVLENLGAAETNLPDCGLERKHSAASQGGPTITFRRGDLGHIDFEYLNIYRNINQGNAWYLVCSIPKKLILASGNQYVYVHEGFSDAEILESAEAAQTAINPDFPYPMSAVFMERAFYTQPGSANILYSEPGQPELILAGNVLVASQAPTGIAALGDGTRGMLYVFNPVGYEIFTTSDGNVFSRSESDSNIGTKGHHSIVPVRTDKGDILLFQGQDGHFYFAAYPTSTPLSKGILDTFVATLNMSALDQTSAFYDPGAREVRWSVCTGSNTVPDKRVILNLTTWGFSFDDQAAALWARDTLSGTVKWLGAAYRDIFYDGTGSGNYDPMPLSCTFSAATNLVTTPTAHGFVAESVVYFYPGSGGALPAAIVEGAAYTVLSAGLTTTEFQLSGVTLAGAGTPTNYVTGVKDITGTWETADLDFGQPEEAKAFQSLEVSAYADAAQSLTVSWYTDLSGTATSSYTVTLTTSPAKYRIPLRGCRGRYIRFNIVNSDNDGKVRINRLVVELVMLSTTAKRT
jgi:hypothetical protein